jgi:hydroxyacylglutathione hydrolase
MTTTYTLGHCRLTVWESALYRTNTALLYWESGCLLLDPNWLPREIDLIREAVDALPASCERWLGITHADYDHLIGLGAFPEARQLVSARLAAHPDPAAVVQAVRDWDEKHYIARSYAHVFPQPALAPSAAAESLLLAGRHFLTWPAPGHTADGLMLLDVEAGILLAGDYLSNLEFPFIGSGFEDYVQTLHTFEEVVDTYQPKLLVPGHGDVALGAEAIRSRIAESREYLQDLQSGNDFPVEKWLSRYPFPGGLEEEHAQNLRMMGR